MECRIVNYDIAHKILRYDLTNGDAARWGVTDLRDEAKENLRMLIDSHGDFLTTWGCAKEAYSAYLRRINGKMLARVEVSIDDLWEQTDLIDDAMYDIGHGDEELTEEDLNYIRSIADECGVDDNSMACEVMEDPTYDQVLLKLEELQHIAIEICDDYFETLKTIVQDCISTRKEN